MKKLLYIIASLALLCSCEYEFEIGDGSNPDKLYVVCVVNEKGTATINIETAVNFDHKYSDSKPLELSTFSLKVNGEERKLEKQLQLDSSAWYLDAYPGLNLWVAEGKVNPSDKIEISASSKTAAEASGSFVMPAPISIRSMKKDIVEVPDMFNERKNEKYNFDIEINDWKEEEYYGVKVLYEYDDTMTVDGNEIDVMKFKRYMYPQEIRYSEGGLDDMLGEIGGSSKWMLSFYNGQGVMTNSYYQGLFLISGKQMSDDHIRFQTDCNRSFVRDYESYDYFMNEETGEWDSVKVNVHSVHHGRYYVSVYRVSPEFYRFSRALYILDNDILSELGLSSNSFSFSNIRGGLGMAGGVTASEEVVFDAPIRVSAE